MADHFVNWNLKIRKSAKLNFQYLIINAEDGSWEPDTASSDSPHHLLLAGVVRKQSGIVILVSML